VKYSAAGSYITEISGTGGGWPSLWLPQFVSVDASNNVYFGSAPSSAIGKYNSSGSWLAGTSDTGSVGIVVDPSGNVWSSDSPGGYPQVNEYNSSLVATGTYFGSVLTNKGGIAFDPSGNFWVVDPSASKVYKFNGCGTQILSFGSSGNGNGQFNFTTGGYFGNPGAITVSGTPATPTCASR
jgi:hypothetical protein